MWVTHPVFVDNFSVIHIKILAFSLQMEGKGLKLLPP
jgi:hypothetical protein